MGYTHYYRGWITISDNFAEDVHKLIAACGVKIGDGMGEGDPIIDEFDEIVLNGAGEAGYETLVLKHGVNHRNFVKTGRMDYDALVAAILLRAANRSRGFKVSSDGYWDEDQWLEARYLYTSVFNEQPVKPDEMRVRALVAV